MGHWFDRLLMALAVRTLRAHEREWMAGDLHEDFTAAWASRGRWPARRWLAGELIRNVSHRAVGRLVASVPRMSSMNWLDLKLGVRLLVKYPGLTLVGGLAMAFAIAVGVITFAIVTPLVYPTLPLEDGERIVEIRSWDKQESTNEPRQLQDFLTWRDTVRSVQHLGAWHDSTRNLVVAGKETRPVRVADMSASGFTVGQGEPLLGRVLTDADARPEAVPVVVLSFETWRSRLDADPDIVGRTVQLGDDRVAVVGVMREGFEFPVAHDVWLPLRTASAGVAPRAGRSTSVFGVLAAGETLDTAQAELVTLGQRMARAFPDTHQHLEPRVSPYADMFAMGPDESAIMFAIYAFMVALLTLICGNVGLLIFARAAARETDLIVRTALGATRGRVVWQLFAEALVLGGLAAAAGMAAADVILQRWGGVFLETNLGRLPFWVDLRLSLLTVAFAVLCAVFGSAVAGVIPALKLTRGMNHRLKQASAGGGGLQFGGVWTVLIVAQIAVTTVFPGVMYWEHFQLNRVRDFDMGFAANEYLTARVDRDATADEARFARALAELRRHLGDEAGVAGVTFAQWLPATWHRTVRLELPAGAGDVTTTRASLAIVDHSYFEVLQSPILAGRVFTETEVRSDARVAMVDQGFVDLVLRGRNPVGQRLRFAQTRGDEASAPNPWYEVVGLVEELGVESAVQGERVAGVYLAGVPERFEGVHVMVHVPSGDPAAFGPRLREIAAGVDSTLRLDAVQRADQVNADVLWVMGAWLRTTAGMSVVAMGLSLAGIFAVLSFAVSRRTREIGVRVALGGSRTRVVGAILRRPLVRVGVGVLLGAAMVLTGGLLMRTTDFPGSDTEITIRHVGLLGAYIVMMFGICLLACLVPARRALDVEPTIALRTE